MLVIVAWARLTRPFGSARYPEAAACIWPPFQKTGERVPLRFVGNMSRDQKPGQRCNRVSPCSRSVHDGYILNGLIRGNCNAFQAGSHELTIPIANFPKV